MSDEKDELPKIEVKSRQDLRNWLSNNHDTSSSVWLVSHKKHTPYYLSYGDLISELICWGWVDSMSGRVDDDRTRVRISPRNPKSAWSAVNKRKVEEARESGSMTPAGEALIKQAVANGMWTFLDDVERLEVPTDLAAVLGHAQTTWDAYPNSVKRDALEWIKTAKKPETRDKRIKAVAAAAVAGQRPARR